MYKILIVMCLSLIYSSSGAQPLDLSNWLMSPNGGEVFQLQSAIPVQINRNVYSPASISVELYKGGLKVDGPYVQSGTSSVSVSFYDSGDDFKIKLYETANPANFDWSDNFFYIGNVPSNISTWIKTPSNSDVLYVNGSMNVSFNSLNESITDNVVIQLYQQNSSGVDVSVSQLYSGTYQNTISFPITGSQTGNNFRLKAYLTNNQLHSDWSDYFSILPDLTNWLLHPQGSGDTRSVGQNIPITVNTTLHTPSQLGVEIYKGSDRVAGPFSMAVAGASISTNSIYYGSNYKVKVFDASNPNWFDWSNSTFSINPNPSDWLVRPNGGEIYPIGKEITIAINGSSSIIIAELYKSDALVYGPVTGSSNSLTIPTAGLVAGNDYKLRIKDDGSQADDSNFPFTLLDISNWIVEPNGAEVFYDGDNDVITVHVDNTKFQSGTFRVELYNGETLADYKVTQTPDGVSFDSRNYSEGNNYKIKISDNTDPLVFDWSDNPFSIASIPNDLTPWIISPNGGEVFIKGQSINVSSNRQLFNPLEVELDLYKDNIQVFSKTGTLDEVGVINTNDLDVGRGYKVRITDKNSVGSWDESNNTFSVLPDLTNWLTQPLQGGKYVPGEGIQIAWNTEIYNPSHLAFELYKGGVLISSIPYSSNIQFVTDNLVPGNDYSVKVYSTDLPEATTTVDITIIDMSEWIVSPNGGEVIYKDDIITIKVNLNLYDPSKDSRVTVNNSYVGFEFYNDGQLITSEITPYSLINGEVKIQSPLPISEKLKVKLMMYNYTFISDISDNFFSYREAPNLNNWVISPKSGDSYKNGDVLKIDIDEFIYNSSKVNVNIFEPGLYSRHYTDLIKTEEGFFEIPLDQLPSNIGYQVAVTATENEDISANSQCCFAILPFRFNTVTSTNFDETGAPYTMSKAYYNSAGQPLQTVSKSFSKEIVVFNEPLRDSQDRMVGKFLPITIPGNTLDYVYNLIPSREGNPYSFLDFEKTVPDPVDNTHANTLGWYYSHNNTLENNVPRTSYPYSRIDFYDDGTGETSTSTSQGDQHRMGAKHEVLSGTFPVYNELDNYLGMRRAAGQVNMSDNLGTTLLFNEGVQSVVRDQNGHYAVSITDKSGKVVMTARPRTDNDTDAENVLIVHNVISSNGDPASRINYRAMTYFYILQPQPVSISGSTDFIVEDIVSNTRLSPGQTFADPNNANNWPVGFYRILLTNSSSAITLSYTQNFLDVSYQFYDDAGRLRSSISPNGLKQFKQGTDYSSIDKTTYSYNHQGWVLAMTEPDAGTTSYTYRKDGKIRFSRNAKQTTNGHFSYTNYDALGRPTESGEYTATDLNFTTLSGDAQYAQLGDNTLVNKKDWIKTYYNGETSFNSIQGFSTIRDNATTQSNPAPYTQNFTRGAVASSQNVNSQTWYSYDDMGRVTWMIQKPTLLPRTFIVEYTYDFLGNVLSVSNKAFDLDGKLQEQFYHYYEYDADKRLLKAYTSLVPTTSDDQRKLRASYEYYLHGPLKRIVLGDNVQGIDFVYNINGWLTQINHPDNMRDPGHDGNGNGVRKDVFGMVLDYYESDLSNLYTAETTSPHDLRRRHHIPFAAQDALVKNYQPLIRFASPFETAQEVTSFQTYSAQNPLYKKIIGESQGHVQENEDKNNK